MYCVETGKPITENHHNSTFLGIKRYYQTHS